MSDKILVAYFSHIGDTYSLGMVKEGNTQILAKHIANYLKADQYHIVGDNKYPAKYMDIIKQAKTEMNNNFRPKLVNPLESIAQYDTIFIGYPIWYGDMPMAVYNFLESYNFSGKTVIPFCTHGGSGLVSTERNIKATCQNSNVLQGLAISGSTAQNNRAQTDSSVASWLKKIGVM